MECTTKKRIPWNFPIQEENPDKPAENAFIQKIPGSGNPSIHGAFALNGPARLHEREGNPGGRRERK